MSVPLPPPEGELTTKRIPRDGVSARLEFDGNSLSLLDILDLFAKFFDLGFDGESRFLNGQVRGFR